MDPISPVSETAYSAVPPPSHPTSTTMPATAPTTAPTTESEPQPEDEPSSATSVKGKLAALNQAERYWTWKAGLRVIIIILNIVAIGCVGWLMSGVTALTRLPIYGLSAFSGWDGGVIASFCVAVAWCLIAIVLPFLLKPSRPLHPGIAVGIDLVLWLGYLALGFFTLLAVYEITQFGEAGFISDSDYSHSSVYSGDYVLAPNNTWYYNITYVRNSNDPYYNYTTDQYEYPPLNTSGVVRDCTPYFDSCAEQDQMVNDIWRRKPQSAATAIVVNAVCWLSVLLFFTIFVWACVDTHRYKSRHVRSKEQIIADRIIADLEKKGLISVADGVVQPARTGRPEMVQAEPSSARYA